MLGMSQARWEAALYEPIRTRVNFTEAARAEMIRLYNSGARYNDIAAETGRVLGSVKTFLRDARRAGMIGRRNRRLSGV